MDVAEVAEVAEQVEDFTRKVTAVREEVSRAVIGQTDVVDGVIVALLCGGHALLEGVPGLGKTTIVKAVGNALGLTFRRIQFTPDLMPADVTGTNVLMQEPSGRRYFEFQRGPIFGNIVLADEINRATPKTQSALLEAMQERTVTVAGASYPLEEPFCVLATQNPIEMEGTYPLPEAQVDRFLLKLRVGYPSREELVAILDRTTSAEEPAVSARCSRDEVVTMKRLVRQVLLADHVRDLCVRLVLATRPDSGYATEMAKHYVRYGASPRACQALVLAAKATSLMRGRVHVSTGDVRKVAAPVLRHRLILNFEAEASGVGTDEIVADVLARTADVS